MTIDATNELVESFLNWLESKVAEANPKISDLWVIKINNDNLTDIDKRMISLLDNSTYSFSDFISLLYKKGYNEFEVGISRGRIEISYTKKYE